MRIRVDIDGTNTMKRYGSNDTNKDLTDIKCFVKSVRGAPKTNGPFWHSPIIDKNNLFLLQNLTSSAIRRDSSISKTDKRAILCYDGQGWKSDT